MRHLRMLAIALIVTGCILLSGCTKTWSVTFEDVYDLAGWDLFVYDAEAKNAIDDNGLMLDAYSATAPFAFSGDVTMTVVFEIFCIPSNPIKDLFFAFLAEPGDGYLWIDFNDLSDAPNEKYSFVDDHYDNKVEFNTLVPGINYIGSNILTFSKTDNQVRIKLNNTEIYNSPYSFFSSDFVAPSFGAIAFQSSGYVLFKSIKVQYSGEMVPR